MFKTRSFGNFKIKSSCKAHPKSFTGEVVLEQALCQGLGIGNTAAFPKGKRAVDIFSNPDYASVALVCEAWVGRDDEKRSSDSVFWETKAIHADSHLRYLRTAYFKKVWEPG